MQGRCRLWDKSIWLQMEMYLIMQERWKVAISPLNLSGDMDLNILLFSGKALWDVTRSLSIIYNP